MQTQNLPMYCIDAETLSLDLSKLCPFQGCFLGQAESFSF